MKATEKACQTPLRCYFEKVLRDMGGFSHGLLSLNLWHLSSPLIVFSLLLGVFPFLSFQGIPCCCERCSPFFPADFRGSAKKNQPAKGGLVVYGSLFCWLKVENLWSVRSWKIPQLRAWNLANPSTTVPYPTFCLLTLVAPSTGWMLYYLCFTPSTALGPPLR